MTRSSLDDCIDHVRTFCEHLGPTHVPAVCQPAPRIKAFIARNNGRNPHRRWAFPSPVAGAPRKAAVSPA